MRAEHALERARRACLDRDWPIVVELLTQLDDDGGLDRRDRERLAVACNLLGDRARGLEHMERLHKEHARAGDIGASVRWAVWAAIDLALAGRHALAGGWVARARRVADSREPPQELAVGWLALPAGLAALGGGDTTEARAAFEHAIAAAEAHADEDLLALGLLGRGQVRLAAGDRDGGLGDLDEAMLAATRLASIPMVTGIVYCAVIVACRDVMDLRRASEWTDELSRWCATHTGLQPYRGQCLVHRSELLQLHGDWDEALAEVHRAAEHLAGGDGDPAVGMAHYQRADLLRLRGRFDDAERAYRAAVDAGHDPQPGLTLLHLAEGRIDDAAASCARLLRAAEDDPVRRARLLAAVARVALESGDLGLAGEAVEGLSSLCAAWPSDWLSAMEAGVRGAWLVAEGEPAKAIEVLQPAVAAWLGLDAPYEAARCRWVLARAHREVGDLGTARLEVASARKGFEAVGAAPDLEALQQSVAGWESARPADGSHDLTPRELEVVRLVATGATNRAVAEELTISERTVARHLHNVFTKLGISSRAAATAWAYEHDLV